MGIFDVAGQTNNYVTSKLINPNNTGGGTHVPPAQIGTGRIPVVTGLKMGPISSYLGGTQYSLTFDEPPKGADVSHYNIFITGVLGNNQSPLGPYSTEASPCYLRIISTNASILTFYVQTVLNNGSVSSLSNSPSVTAQSVAPQYFGTTTSAIMPAPNTNVPVSAKNTDNTLFLDCNGQIGAFPTQVFTVTSPTSPADGQSLLLLLTGPTIPPGTGAYVNFLASPGQTTDALSGSYDAPGTKYQLQYNSSQTHWVRVT